MLDPGSSLPSLCSPRSQIQEQACQDQNPAEPKDNSDQEENEVTEEATEEEDNTSSNKSSLFGSKFKEPRGNTSSSYL